ncbi:MAG TPA: hypothetical protein VJB08_04010 [Candidatus Nanoarchaeia archaeon]|nr:hypothetical protein [Candidatus Nanoarchaeia archaeon]
MRNKLPFCLTSLIFIATILLAFPFVHAQIPSLNDPHIFYGDLTGASAGVTIIATLNGATAGSLTTTAAGQYGCANGAECHQLIVYQSGATAGNTITFSAGSGSSLSPSSYPYQPGNTTRLNINYSTTAAATSSTGGGGGGGGGGAGATGATTPVTDSATISRITATIPPDWTNVRIDQVGETATVTTTPAAAAVESALQKVTSPEAIAALQSVLNQLQSKEAVGVTVTKTLAVFKVQNKETGEELYRSQIIVVFTAPEDMKDVKVIEVILKDVAASSDDLIFPGIKPRILQKDPVLEFAVDVLKKGQTATFDYIVKKQLTEITSSTVAAGVAVEAPEAQPEVALPEIKKEEAPPTPPGKLQPSVLIGIIIILAIVIVGLLAYKKKRKK